MELNSDVLDNSAAIDDSWRLSSEAILPQNIKEWNKKDDGYDIYPYHTLGSGKIFNGYDSLAQYIIEQKNVRIDGFNGVFWDTFQQGIQACLQQKGVTVKWIQLADQLKSSDEIEKLVTPFLGELGSVWGTKCTLAITDFLQMDQVAKLQPDSNYEVNIAVGIGAALLLWNSPIIYLDLPKNEVQYRFRAGTISNFGTTVKTDQSEMYKRSYFVDWAVLNAHKEAVVKDITVVADVQWKDSLNWTFNSSLQKGLKEMSQSVLRARPWFAAGAWGGHWMQDRIEGLNKEEVNYAWSFELIVPENGLVFESDGNLLEVSFDFLMFNESKAVLGKHATVFGTEFPIRFDFLDTFEGGNLSIQCHPSLSYIQKEFGENITQDETYYILDSKPGAEVYLGFQDDINPDEFEAELVASQELSKEIDITKYVQSHKAAKHDLFLIPNGTVHSAGAESLVLEISATPYIFTFKMYDWMRMGLDGQPRPINIDHAFKNLNFERKGERVQAELISKPTQIAKGEDWELIHLPTHEQHFYDIHRLEFDSEVKVRTADVCHILMLVEGTRINVETDNGVSLNFEYAETFVIPAAAKQYKITNLGKGKAKVVKAFVKDQITTPFN